MKDVQWLTKITVERNEMTRRNTEMIEALEVVKARCPSQLVSIAEADRILDMLRADNQKIQLNIQASIEEFMEYAKKEKKRFDWIDVIESPHTPRQKRVLTRHVTGISDEEFGVILQDIAQTVESLDSLMVDTQILFVRKLPENTTDIVYQAQSVTNMLCFINEGGGWHE